MNTRNTISRLIRQYQTRQQLNDLPLYLIEDIGKTPEEIKHELSKNSFKLVWVNKLSALKTDINKEMKINLLSQPLNRLFSQLLRRA